MVLFLSDIYLIIISKNHFPLPFPIKKGGHFLAAFCCLR